MSQQLSRKQLYDLVWSNPIAHLAKEFGIGDSVIRIICKKYDIPLPKMGYWQKVKYGKKVFKENLTHYKKWSNLKISIHKSELNEKEHYLTVLARQVNEINNECEKLLPVPDVIVKPHRLIKGAKLYLNAQKKATSWRGFPACIETRGDLLSISVQRHNVKRSLRIMNTLLKMSELRGHKIIVEYNTTKILIGEECYTFRLREKHNRVKVLNSSWDATDLVPNDKLSIKEGESYSKKEWVDKSILLEEQLTGIIAYFELRAIRDKERRVICELERAAEEKREALEKIEKDKRDWELKKKDILLTCAQNWKKSEDLRQFISQIENNNVLNKKTIDWLNWAKIQVEELNPLSLGNDSFIEKFEFLD